MALVIALLGVFGPALSLVLRELVERWLERLPASERPAALDRIRAAAGKCLTKTRCETTGVVTYGARVTEAEAIEAFAKLAAGLEARVAEVESSGVTGRTV